MNKNRESEVNDMETALKERNGYRRLDMSKINFSDNPMSMEDALKDSEPIDWPEEILLGERKILLKNPEKDKRKKCVKLEISY